MDVSILSFPITQGPKTQNWRYKSIFYKRFKFQVVFLYFALIFLVKYNKVYRGKFMTSDDYGWVTQDSRAILSNDSFLFFFFFSFKLWLNQMIHLLRDNPKIVACLVLTFFLLNLILLICLFCILKKLLFVYL